jgi:hypothetical protein
MNRRNEDGWVMIPAIVLMIVALGLAFALLAMVDTQTSQSRLQRSSDAAQTLAEGVAAATANVLAADSSSASWWNVGTCQRVEGDLTTPPTGATTSLGYRVKTEVQARFAGSSSEYATGAGRSTAWKVDVCPDNGLTRWDDSYLAQSIQTPVATSPTQIAMWVRSQARVRVTNTAQRSVTTRAVATKIRQSRVDFIPPTDYSVGTGSFSTDLTVSGTSALQSGLLHDVLGSKPLIADTTTKIGVRCGILSTLDNPATTCLSGTFSGISGVTNATGLDTLNSIIGTSRAKQLQTWTMAPTDAIATWKALAQTTGVYKSDANPAPGANNVRNPSGYSATPPACYSETTTSSTVVYITRVGSDSEQYCTLPTPSTAKIVVIERGGVVVSGAFTGVVYALNKQECTQADGSCSSNDHKSAPLREVVRIQGNSGKVTGSVWADGAGGEVGIYPSLNSSQTATTAVLGGLCSNPLLAAALGTLNATLTTVTGLLNTLLGTERWRFPGGVSSTSGCQLLTNTLGTLTNSQLLTLFSNGGTVQVVTAEHQTRATILSPWPATWTPDPNYTKTISVPALTSDLINTLTATLTNYTAIKGDASVITNAKAPIPVGGGPDTGTYRNIAPN